MNASHDDGLALAGGATITRSQTDVVIDGIKDLITTGTLGPGSRLPIEKDLALQLGVSRGSLREGVRALTMLGVLDTRQGDGTYVTSLDPLVLLRPLGFLVDLQTPETATHLLGVRRILEGESAARAAVALTDEQLARLHETLATVDRILESDPDMDLEGFIRADAEFHRQIANASGNPALAGLIETLVSRTYRMRLWRAVIERGSVREAHAEHRAILTELAARDPERARIRMSVHLLGVEEFMADHTADDTATTNSSPVAPSSQQE